MNTTQKDVDKLLIDQQKPIPWDTVLKKIQQKSGDLAFQTWFSRLTLHAVVGKIVTIAAPNTFILNFVEKNHAIILKNALYEATGQNFETTFIVTDNAEDQKIIQTIAHEIKTVRCAPPKSAPQLNQRYSFENFVIGSNNQFAYTSSLAVAEAPGRKNFNPLIIYGNTGLGKTHLLQAIGNFALSEETAERVLYAPAIKFVEDFMKAIVHKTKSPVEFHRRYRDIDILLIDDIQFLAGKPETQNQFYQVFEELTARKKQIIISSDRHPDEIKEMNVRLLNRFSGGLLVDIQPPNFETKIAILKKKAEQDGLSLPPDVLETIATCPTENVRELDGLLIKIMAYSNFTGHEISVDLIRQVLGETVTSMRNPVTTSDILTTVALEFGISRNKLCALSRAREVAIPRHVCMYFCKKFTNGSLATIGVTFNRNHATVLHAIRKCNELLASDALFKEKVERIEKMLASR
ncbi:MAG: hypothetical protein A2268_16915 [Candidatus Raymondbacteria bacterium RifOxyA12_full_50_37]|nr:MAG: hypothetical protein A2268_16915 [Candidatus Raymondbacteria bacterium RifOxyA12_full_50_37]OGJ86291.1 MAG: hypothetical protein A2248_16515 [Candidatus Raymondbacteria bacterium RIFOXYA2_FULL_49_16]OGJ95829.1 MAG: hypothetical protein A2453_11825 [Candidatus Raymondbacteria bacterium RIFOXYC2_FULL_50_21]OGJ99041.1 MAG: hypothetical protein A2350_17255 [Candidatus Raymondbacteria bacterium RifOxyB12_full_50_8]OGK05887.1 MAG: hypothetical protein A2487_01980 [Candidatus Raymondbacteria b